MNQLPSDPVMLLSVINLKLRDFYPNLDALCEDLELNKEEIINALAAIDCHYEPDSNRFL